MEDFGEVIDYAQMFDPIENFTRFEGTGDFEAAYNALVGSNEWSSLQDSIDNLANNQLPFQSIQNILHNLALLAVSDHPDAVISALEAWIEPLENEDIDSMTPIQKLIVRIAEMNVDVQDLNVDYYCFSAHKLYGPTGVGVLYGKEDLLNYLPPYQGGGEMIQEVTFEKTTYAELPHKFEAGTPNIAAVIAFKSAIDFILKLGLDNITKYENELLEYATSEISKIDGIKIFGTSEHKTSIISFNIKGIHHYDVGVILDKMGVAIRTGHHCTQPVMKKFNIAGTSRVSFAYYNTTEEIDYFILALKKAIKMLS